MQAITLMGMSGVGKTTLSCKLPRDKWFHYSSDYRIATHYLDDAIGDFLKVEAMQSALLRISLLIIWHRYRLISVNWGQRNWAVWIWILS